MDLVDITSIARDVVDAETSWWLIDAGGGIDRSAMGPSPHHDDGGDDGDDRRRTSRRRAAEPGGERVADGVVELAAIGSEARLRENVSPTPGDSRTARPAAPGNVAAAGPTAPA